MNSLFGKYLLIPKTILFLLMGDVFLQLVNAAFTLTLNFHLINHGYPDFEIASLIGNRYLTVLLCSIPLALFVKGKKLKPFMLVGVIASPLIALLLVCTIHFHATELTRILMGAWGISFSLLQILVMPYLLLNGDVNTETESIALFFAAGNFTTIIAGGINYILPALNPFFNEEIILYLLSALGLLGAYFIWNLPDTEKIATLNPNSNFQKDYDWQIIAKALFPTFLIAFGAGFTIPIINLFFNEIHLMNAAHFSLMNMVAFVLVSVGSLLIPAIKNKMGYKFSIVFFQVLAIIALFILGASEWYAPTALGLWIAITAYIARQPLMNIAAPMTSELTMKYVGERNREMVSAIISAIWSGSWFASAQIFAVLRESKIAYSNIIFITVVFYAIGVFWYYLLILDFEKKELK